VSGNFETGLIRVAGSITIMGTARGTEAYINVDQEHFTISVAGETLFTGDPAKDPRLKRCVSEY
jgi:hypothetical protein